jgi:Na+/proline symporter
VSGQGDLASIDSYKERIQHGNVQLEKLRKEYKVYIKKALPAADDNDTNYIFLRFVVDYLPVGLVGLLIAIIFLAAWGSIAAALNSLASCTMIDFHQRFRKGGTIESDEAICEREYKTSRWYTFAWGIFSIIVAQFANRMGSLIEAVNVLGSLFYGVILGIFLVAFYMKKIGGKAVFWSAVVSEIAVIILFLLNQNNIIGLSFLWLNVAGALFVVVLSLVLSATLKSKPVIA